MDTANHNSNNKTENGIENSDTKSPLEANTSTDESQMYPEASISIKRIMPSLGPRKISLKAGAKFHQHSENNHT